MSGFLIGGRFLTGEITVRKLIPKTARVDLVLNDSSTVDADVNLPLEDPMTGATVDLPNELVPGRDAIGWFENGTLLTWGPIGRDPFAFPQTSKLIGGDTFDYFADRFVLPVLGPSQTPSDVTSAWSSLSLGTLQKRIVQQACSWPNANLPIDYQPDLSGTHEREYPGADAMRVDQAVQNISEVEGGTDFTFRPKLTVDRRHVRVDFLTGDPQLSQAGADHYWDVSVPTPDAAVLRLDRDATDLATHAYGFGATTDDVRLEAKAVNTALTAAGFPMRERVERRNSVVEAETLQGHVDEAVVRYSMHTETFTVEVDRNPKVGPKLGSYWPGDWAKLRIGENPRIPADTYRTRIVRITFGATGLVTLTCAPERVVGGYPIPAASGRWEADRMRRLSARVDESNRGA